MGQILWIVFAVFGQLTSATGCYGVSGSVRRGPGTPDVIISDKAAKKNDGHPDQERQYREPLDGRTTADRFFPVLFVLSERDLEDGGDKRSDTHEEHLHPKRKRH